MGALPAAPGGPALRARSDGQDHGAPRRRHPCPAQRRLRRRRPRPGAPRPRPRRRAGRSAPAATPGSTPRPRCSPWTRPTTPASAGWSPGRSPPGPSPRCAPAPRRSPPSCSTSWPGPSSARASVDLVRRYAALVPVTVIAEMLGAPPEMRGNLLAWGDGAAASSGHGHAVAVLRARRARPGRVRRAGCAGTCAGCGDAPGRGHALHAGAGRRRRRVGPDRARAGRHLDAASSRPGSRRRSTSSRNGTVRALRAPRAAGAARRGPRAVAERRGGGAAPRLAGAAHGPDGTPRHRGRRACRSRRARSS